MKFFATEVKLEDRHTEEEEPPLHHRKTEEITLTLKITGQGDSTKFSDEQILSSVMNSLYFVEPTGEVSKPWTPQIMSQAEIIESIKIITTILNSETKVNREEMENKIHELVALLNR